MLIVSRPRRPPIPLWSVHLQSDFRKVGEKKMFRSQTIEPNRFGSVSEKRWQARTSYKRKGVFRGEIVQLSGAVSKLWQRRVGGWSRVFEGLLSKLAWEVTLVFGILTRCDQYGVQMRVIMSGIFVKSWIPHPGYFHAWYMTQCGFHYVAIIPWVRRK